MTKVKTVERIHNALRALERKANVAAYVILKDGQHVGTVRFSYPRDGAGKLQALVADWTAERPRDRDNPTVGDFSNWTPWQYGCASGGGCDKHTAAMRGMIVAGVTIEDSGLYWHDQLRKTGPTVIQAV